MATSMSLDLRRRVAEAYRQGELSYEEVAARFSVGRASVSRWLRIERETGDVEPRPHGGGQPRRINSRQEKIVERLVLEHPDWTEAEFADVLAKEHGIVASAVTVGRVIRRLGFSVKKTLVATERGRPYIIRRRGEYGEQVRGIAPARLVFVDETGTNVAMTRL